MPKSNFCCTPHPNPKICMCVRTSTPDSIYQFVLCRIVFFKTAPGAFLLILALGSRPKRALTPVNMFTTPTHPKQNQLLQKSLYICAWICSSIKCVGLGVLQACVGSKTVFWAVFSAVATHAHTPKTGFQSKTRDVDIHSR